MRAFPALARVMQRSSGMAAQEKTLTELAKSAADRLSALRTEAALQLHLAGMEAKDAWAEIGPQVEALEHRLEDAVNDASTGQAKLELHLALMEARERWRAIQPRILGVADDAKAGLERAFEEMSAALDRRRPD